MRKGFGFIVAMILVAIVVIGAMGFVFLNYVQNGGGSTATSATSGVSGCTYLKDVNTGQSLPAYCTAAQSSSFSGFKLSSLSVQILLPSGGSAVIYNSSTGASSPIRQTIQLTIVSNSSVSKLTVMHTALMFMDFNTIIATNSTNPITFSNLPSGTTIGSISRDGKVIEITDLGTTAGPKHTLSIADVGMIHAVFSNGFIVDQSYGCPYGSLYAPTASSPCTRGGAAIPASQIRKNILNVSLNFLSQIPQLQVTSISGTPVTQTGVTTTTNTNCPAGTAWGGYNAQGVTACIPVTVTTSTGTPASIQVLQRDIKSQCSSVGLVSAGFSPSYSTAFASGGALQGALDKCSNPSWTNCWYFGGGTGLNGQNTVNCGVQLVSGATSPITQSMILSQGVVVSCPSGYNWLIVNPYDGKFTAQYSNQVGSISSPICVSSTVLPIITTPVVGASVSVSCCFQYNTANPNNPAVGLINAPALVPASASGVTDANGFFSFSIVSGTIGSMNGYFVVGTTAVCCQPSPLQPAYIVTAGGVQTTFTIGQPMQPSYTLNVLVDSPAYQQFNQMLGALSCRRC